MYVDRLCVEALPTATVVQSLKAPGASRVARASLLTDPTAIGGRTSSASSVQGRFGQADGQLGSRPVLSARAKARSSPLGAIDILIREQNHMPLRHFVLPFDPIPFGRQLVSPGEGFDQGAAIELCRIRADQE
jgi:hypothetical protein